VKGLTHSLAVVVAHWRVGAQYEVQYRLNFVLQVVESAVRLVTGVVAIRIVYSFTTSLRGWEEPELLAVLGVHILLGGVLATFVMPNMHRFRYEVHQGELDYALVRPVDTQLFVSARQISFWNLVDVVTGAVVIGWAVAGLAGRVGFVDAVVFAVALACGGVILYSVWMMFTTTVFWLVDLRDADQIINGLYDAGRWPIRIYPFWLQGALTAVVPLGVAITVPAEALTGRVTPGSMAVLVVVAAVTVAAARAFWNLGVRNYSGASA